MTQSKRNEDNTRPETGRFFLPLNTDIRSHLIFWPLAVGGLAADLWSKHAVFEWLLGRFGGSFAVIEGFFHLVTAENTGAAFGIAAGRTVILVGVSVVALLIVLAFFLFGRADGCLMYTALGVFAAGISGNLYDRLFNEGRVRDFIDIVYWPGRHWPAFNLADSMLCIGVGLMIIMSLRDAGRKNSV